VKEENGYYYWRQAEGVWQMIQGIFNPENTTTTITTTTTTTTSTESCTCDADEDCTCTTTTLPGQEVDKPKTGNTVFKPGVAVCMALLIMCCGYCGFQMLRRRNVRPVKAR